MQHRYASLPTLACAFAAAAALAQPGDNVLEETPLPIVELTAYGEVDNEITPGFNRAVNLRIYDGGGVNTLADAPVLNLDSASTRFRGSSSLSFPKKNYKLDLTNPSTGEKREEALFGFPQNDDWALHAPYSDKSLMRNALAYKWAGEYMPWAPRAKYVDLVVNGSYEGVHLFTELVRRDNDRVDVAKLTPEDTEGDDLTGGYLLEIGDDEANAGRSFFSAYSQVPGTEATRSPTQFQLDYPDFDDLAPEQFAYIEDYVAGVEQRLAPDDYGDAATGYRNYVDVPSWVDYALIQEVTANFDAYNRSTWVVKDRDDNGGRHAAGPAWDFNIGFGNNDRCYGQDGVAGWMMTSNPEECVVRTVPFFVRRFFEDPTFKARMRARYEALRQTTFSDASVRADIDSLQAVLRDVQPADQRRWGNVGLRVEFNDFVGATWQEEVDYLEDWILRRLAWIDGAIREFPTVESLQERNSELRVVRVDVPGGGAVPTDRVGAALRVIDNGPDQLNSPDGSATGYLGDVSVEIRGDDDAKPAYSLELQDGDGDGRDFRLLDMPKEEDWVLLAPYSDKTLIRDAVGFDLADELLPYSPRTRAAQLYVNDEYRGVYVMTEEVKRDDSRVDIAKLDDDEVAGDDLTGGYLLEVDGPAGDNPDKGFAGAVDDNTGAKTFYRYDTPDDDDIVAEQRAYIADFVRGVEQDLADGGYAAVEDRLSVKTFTGYILAQELVGNAAAYSKDTYLYKDKDSDDGRLKAGPLWDLDKALGNDADCGGTDVTGWVIEAGEDGRCGAEKVVPALFQALWADPAFRTELVDRWREARTDDLSNEALRASVAKFAAEVRSGAEANFERYPILGVAVGRNAFVGQTYAEEVDYLSDWLVDRATWIDTALEAPLSSVRSYAAAQLSVYPNPGRGAPTLTVEVGTSTSETRLEVRDALGRLRFAEVVAPGASAVTVPSGEFSRGVYAIQLLRDGDTVGVAKWVN